MRLCSAILASSIPALAAREETPPPRRPPAARAPPAETAPTPAPRPPPPAPRPRMRTPRCCPRKLLFKRNPDRLPPRAEPRRQAHPLHRAETRRAQRLRVSSADDPRAAKVVTHERTRPIRTAYWARERPSRCSTSNDKGGDENFHVFAVEVESGKEKDLTPFDGVRSNFEGTFDKKPDLVYVTMNRRDKKHMDPVLVDLETGKLDVLLENTEGYEDFVVDHDAQLRMAVKPLPDGGKEAFALDKKKAPKSLFKIPFEDAGGTELVGFDRSGKTVYLIGTPGAATPARRLRLPTT